MKFYFSPVLLPFFFCLVTPVKGAELILNSGAILLGGGSVTGGNTILHVGSTLAPGTESSSDCLTLENLNFSTGGELNIHIGGTDVCTDYDQVTGIGTVSIATNTTLSVSALNSFVPSLFEKFIIVSNDSTDSVQGTFSDLDQGDTIDLAGVQLTINYKDGSDGNDITLTVKGDQTISFEQPEDRPENSSNFVLNATSSSGLSVVFESNTPEICTVNGNTVTILRAGTCSITAIQAGDSYYNSAAEITRVFEIHPFPWEMFLPAIIHPKTT